MGWDWLASFLDLEEGVTDMGMLCTSSREFQWADMAALNGRTWLVTNGKERKGKALWLGVHYVRACVRYPIMLLSFMPKLKS